jgi:hypothetical protein
MSKILFALTSHAELGDTGRKTGYPSERLSGADRDARFSAGSALPTNRPVAAIARLT